MFFFKRLECLRGGFALFIELLNLMAKLLLLKAFFGDEGGF